MTGREGKLENDIFFLCSLIEYLSRKTQNEKLHIAQKIGKEGLSKILDLADVYHSESLEKLADDFINKYNISPGSFDNISRAKYTLPTHWDIGKVYKRLALAIMNDTQESAVEVLFQVYSSPIAKKIDNFNSSMYFESPQYIYESYKAGECLE